MANNEYSESSRTEHEYIKQTRVDSEYLLSLKSEQAINTVLGWHGGKIGKYRYEVNVSKKSSKLGINNGKVWKLCIWDGEKGMAKGCVVNYDGGWQIRPDKEFEPYVKQILKIYD
ncbi:DUF7678 domain-containing protein [Runella slithyformis]|uniref:DUF7678 domain-containing protein n=1 Tax=Runella slithyformis (strain ATCC 29530 / DSM 19594 / LMG 11500 / NCIMB 11436 / LSU 4) TaxID=761193 RepID=A0A7U3ZPM8_RUNSL|nr:hypothetical protein [Runella slithyformis]AEI51046.1 hypothetical protein Runsl_4728 [Runella slithyformis DSM 19594]